MIFYILLALISLILYLIYYIFLNPYFQIQKLKKLHGNDIYTYFYPIIGIFKLEQLKKGDPLHFHKELIKKNPDIKAIVSNLGPYVLILVLSPQGIKDLLIEHPHKYDKFIPLFLFDQIDQSVIFTKKNKHKYQRKLISKCFDFNSLRFYLPDIKITIQNRFQNLQQQSKDKFITFKVCHETMDMAGEIGVKLFFGNEFNDKTIDGKPINLQLADLVDSLVSYSHDSLFFNIKRVFLGYKAWQWEWLCSKQEKKIINKANTITKLSQDTIQKRIKYNQDLQKEGKLIQQDNVSFIDVLIQEYLRQQDPEINKKLDENEKLSLKEIHQQSLGMYIAGTDNTGVQMGMVLYCLAKYKDCTKKIQEEINQHIPNFNNNTNNENENEITIELLNKLDYMQAFIKETFRHHSSSTGQFIRKCNQPHYIDGIKMEKNMMIHPTWYGPFNNPKFYSDPEEFNPEYFLGPKNVTIQNPFCWTPFAAGPRNCIGMTLSIIEIKIMIIYFLKMFDFEVNNEVKLQKQHHLTMQPINDEIIRIKSK